MRIGLILSASPGYSETFLKSKILGLKEKGHSVLLFCQKSNPDFSLCEVRKLPSVSIRKGALLFKLIIAYLSLIPHVNCVIKYYKLERKEGVSVFQIMKKVYLNAAFFKEKLDWLHFGFGTLSIGRENLAKAIDAKLAVSFRGFDIGIYPLKHPNCYAKLWNKVDKIHVISNDIKTLLYSNNFKDQAPVVKITPAIDVDFFTTTQNKENDSIQFITVARLHWKKGLDYTLEALALLKKQGVTFHYTIIGNGPQEEYFKFLAHQLNLSSSVTFKGQLGHDKIKEALSEADIYLQYSVQEGFCNAVLEAQAMGLLCVVSDAEGLSENVLHNETGWVVPLRKPELLVEKIRSVISLPQTEKDGIIQRAKDRVKHEFNVNKQQQKFYEFYENNR
ncbi:glycosyltransferase family 4 protein [Winogradskyella immobilis]|uniref:Glycosyltransferase family 4 protein n=1 Tax=Winogradskyella immobilis TaxID=2816852 RepID=A0ABS8ENW3_9FLAO|nr:glycosyltransferase family 4 protein [Winogradskyella immobilis]MCC1484889.1 glycosyltransferase family 4 protein [Winogradskyella immobilis]MCG0016981.1 glycosyltransferase family 4 protein [Winogradskyella immobilis]